MEMLNQLLAVVGVLGVIFLLLERMLNLLLLWRKLFRKRKKDGSPSDK